MSLLPSASNIVITGGSFVQHNDATKELMPLYEKVAPNAILNSGGRADPVSCHPGTREEVIGKMEKRIAGKLPGDSGVFWLSGPAGAGKSAIMQTVAERCIERKVPMVNFFFFRSDDTRNHSGAVVATLLFQLFDLFPLLRAHVAAIASQNPVIFRQSMRQQFSMLIETPLLAIVKDSQSPQLVILIDGLDECSFGNGKDDQVSLLNILYNISTRPVSTAAPAYVVLVASRTEGHLTTAFNKIGCHPDSIYLDESYRPSDDIRVFLTYEFSEIKRTHTLRDTLPPDWPLSSAIDVIIEKSSGQFVYAATATRFVSTSNASPKRSLEIVLGLRLPTKTSPFATLDILYTYILSQAEDWSSVHDILATQIILSSTLSTLHRSLTTIIRPSGYTEDDVLSNLSDLTAIIQFRAGQNQLTLHHASLNDFLLDKGRACEFYVDINAFACRLVPLHFRQSAHRDDLHYSFRILKAVTEPDKELTSFMKMFLPEPEPFRAQDIGADFQGNWMGTLAALYGSRDLELYEHMGKRWEGWFAIVNGSSQASGNRGIAEPASSLQAVPNQPSLRSSTPPLPHNLPALATDSYVAGTSNPVQAPAAVSHQQPSQRPSTQLSRFFRKFTPRRNREAKK